MIAVKRIQVSGRSDTNMQALKRRIAKFLKRRGARVRPSREWRFFGWFEAFVILGLTAGLAATTAVPRAAEHDDQGTFLVARRELNNPLFGKTVILMLPKNTTPLVVGLIVNKPTRVQLRDVFPDSRAPREKLDAKAYFGGPVDVDSPSAIFRSPTPPKNAIPVFDDVYVTFDGSTITALAENPQQASPVHIFLGRSQWAPEQLQNEVAKGAWYTTRGDADAIFSSHPETAWPTLLKRLEPRPLVEYEPPLRQQRAVSDGASLSSPV